MVFQKGCFGDHCGYRIVEAGKAMSSIEVKSRDRFGPAPKPEDDNRYMFRAYVPAERDALERFGFNDALSRELQGYVVLMQHYLKRLHAVKDKRWGDFVENRIDLLGIENMWAVLRDMEAAMRAEPNPMNALLRIDPTIAEMFLELKSFRWQYQAMTDKFYPFKNTWTRKRTQEKLEALYRDHYVHPEGDIFRDEVIAHLQYRRVAESRWDEVIAAVKERVAAFDTVKFSKSNGGKGIPFSKILDEVIG